MTDVPRYRSYGDAYGLSDEEIRRTFPPGREPPPLLLGWAQWLRRQPAGWLGDLDLGCHRRDSAFDAELSLFFADVIKGGNFAASFWLHEQAGLRPPILLQDDEGGLEVIPSLEAFLARLALGVHAEDDNPVGGAQIGPENGEKSDPLGEFDPLIINALGYQSAALSLLDGAGSEDAARLRGFAREGRSRLGAWLLKETGARSLESLLHEGAPAPDFATWMQAKEAARATSREEQSARLQILREMTSPVVLVLWAGDSYTAVTGGNGAYMPPYAPAPDGAAIKPHLAVLREAAARRTPSLGLWHSAIVTHPRFNAAQGARIAALLKDRGVSGEAADDAGAFGASAEAQELIISPTYHFLYPRELAQRFTPSGAEFRKDQMRRPRHERYIEPWLRDLLRS